jgi:agmatinase
VEWFDREFDCEPVVQFGIHTMNPLGLVHRSPEAMVQAIEEAVATVLSGSPTPDVLTILGGEHTVSVGVVRGLARVIERRVSESVGRIGNPSHDLVAVQIDAHADLRDEYEGSPYSHACAARRIVETCPVFQIGIRNISAAEESFRRESDRVKTFFAEDSLEGPELLEQLGNFVRGKQVFLTIDLDGLDPSIMPAVGTPEPGGLSWARTLEVVRVVCREAAGVPAFDVVELAPIPGFIAPDFLAAKLVYKIMSLVLMPRE